MENAQSSMRAQRDVGSMVVTLRATASRDEQQEAKAQPPYANGRRSTRKAQRLSTTSEWTTGSNNWYLDLHRTYRAHIAYVRLHEVSSSIQHPNFPFPQNAENASAPNAPEMQ